MEIKWFKNPCIVQVDENIKNEVIEYLESIGYDDSHDHIDGNIIATGRRCYCVGYIDWFNIKDFINCENDINKFKQLTKEKEIINRNN